MKEDYCTAKEDMANIIDSNFIIRKKSISNIARLYDDAMPSRKDQDYSLNAGRYVGVVIEDDGMTEAEFKDTMLGLNKEFEDMNAEAKALEAQIAANIKALFGE